MNRGPTEVAEGRIEPAPGARRRFGNRPVALLDGKHVGNAIPGKIAEPQLIHRERGASNQLPIDVRQRGHEPLAVGRAAECVRRSPCRARAVIAYVRIETPELDLAQRHAEGTGAERLPLANATAKKPPLSVPLRKHVAAKVIVEVSQLRFA